MEYKTSWKSSRSLMKSENLYPQSADFMSHPKHCNLHSLLPTYHVNSGVAKPGPTRALAPESAHLALALEIDDDHMINLYSLQLMA